MLRFELLLDWVDESGLDVVVVVFRLELNAEEVIVCDVPVLEAKKLPPLLVCADEVNDVVLGLEEVVVVCVDDRVVDEVDRELQ